MNWFKRLCMFVFGLSGLLALAALCLTWVGPWTTQARSMLELSWYFIALEVLVCISALGLLICLLVALFHPRNPKETIVADVSGGTITVTRAAIISQARHIVEADGSCVASAVHVRMRKRGHVRVSLRITPRRPVDVVSHGAALHAALEEGLAHVCGDCVRSISLVFNEPEQQGSLPTHVETTPEAGPSRKDEAQPTSQPITVPVSSLATTQEPVIEAAWPEEQSSSSDELAYAEPEPEPEAYAFEPASAEPVADELPAADAEELDATDALDLDATATQELAGAEEEA